MEVLWRLGYFAPKGGLGKIIGKNGKYTATIAKIDDGLLAEKIQVLGTQTFNTTSEASAWMQKNGYKSIRSDDHQHELGYYKYINWFTS